MDEYAIYLLERIAYNSLDPKNISFEDYIERLKKDASDKQITATVIRDVRTFGPSPVTVPQNEQGKDARIRSNAISGPTGKKTQK